MFANFLGFLRCFNLKRMGFLRLASAINPNRNKMEVVPPEATLPTFTPVCDGESPNGFNTIVYKGSWTIRPIAVWSENIPKGKLISFMFYVSLTRNPQPTSCPPSSPPPSSPPCPFPYAGALVCLSLERDKMNVPNDQFIFFVVRVRVRVRVCVCA
jgi:hypothetical protein